MTNSGISRTAVHRNHALISPESHVPIHFPQWPGCEAVMLISPEMGAKFSQCLVTLSADGRMSPLRVEEQVFLLVLDGRVRVNAEGFAVEPATDGFCYLPPGGWSIEAIEPARLLMFTKPFVAAGDPPPQAFGSSLDAVAAEPFLGDEGALLQVLFPDDANFDFGINVFRFAPGGTLPQVESHFMEHGLYLLDGQGVYRLGDHWYPVEAGDTIWMGPFLPQWYVAAGKTDSRYIYYKEMNRAPIAAG